MKKNFPWKGFLIALILLLLAAGSVTVAWIVNNPPDGTAEPPQNSTGSVVASTQTSVTQSLTEIPLSTAVTDPEYSDVTGTGTQSDTGTDTNTETSVTDTGSVTETVDTATQTETSSTETVSTSTIPTGEILGTITPPPDGSPKKIAFTFDDGPYEPVTRAIADEFAKYGGHCTFFVVGNRVGTTAYDNGVLKYASDLGHEIAIHGYSHTVYYNKCSEDSYLYEVQTTASRIEAAIGIAPTLMRPPGGSITNTRVANCPYSIILWNVDTKDYSYSRRNQQNIDTIARNILTSVTAGDIVLMHDLYYNSLEAVKIVLPLLAEQGYEFVTVSELLGEEMQPGKKYIKSY